jgi:hypothetical protein
MNNVMLQLTDTSAYIAARAQALEQFGDNLQARPAVDALADQVECIAQQIPDHLPIIRSVVDDAHRLLLEALVELDQGPADSKVVPALLRVADRRLCKAFHALGAMQAVVAAQLRQIVHGGRLVAS